MNRCSKCDLIPVNTMALPSCRRGDCPNKGGNVAKKQTKFPKTIFVSVEGEGDNEFFQVHEDVASVAEVNVDKKVGVYELVKTAVVTTKAELI